MEAVRDFIFLDSKITVDGDWSYEIKWHFLFRRKSITKLDSILKRRHCFADRGPYSQSYGFSSSHVWMWEWTIKKAEHWRINTFELCWRRFLRVPWTARRSNQPILKEISLDIHWKDWCWSSNTLSTWCEELIHWTRSWCWARLRAGGEKGDRGWDGWMASPTQWTWVWASSRRLWRTGKPSVLQSMWWQRVRNDIATERWPQLNSPCEL